MTPFYLITALVTGAAIAVQTLANSRLRVALGTPVWAAGALMSCVSACAGMGAGTLVVPYLQMRGLNLARATATSNALNLTVAVGATSLFLVASGAGAHGGTAPQWQCALSLGAFAVAAVPAGVAIAPHVPARRFRGLLGVVTVTGALVLAARVACRLA